MVEFHLVYNPYRVETHLSVKLAGHWVAVEEESGLPHFAKSRMQRWIYPPGNDYGERCYFDALREASGERDIVIFFSGTDEDMADLVHAASLYCRTHHGINITVRSAESVAKNGGAQKAAKLNELIDVARASAFHSIVPERIWEYMEREILGSISSPVRFLPLPEWEQGRGFEPEAWQMLCLTFSYHDMQGESVRGKLKKFSECMSSVNNRNMERERFLFFCRAGDDELVNIGRSGQAVNKLMMEYGLQDICILLLTEEEIAMLKGKEPMPDKRLLSARFHVARQMVDVYRQRYAGQYRLKKKLGVLLEMLATEGLSRFGIVEDRMHKNTSEGMEIKDEDVKAAYAWILEFIEALGHVLDIGDETGKHPESMEG